MLLKSHWPSEIDCPQDANYNLSSVLLIWFLLLPLYIYYPVFNCFLIVNLPSFSVLFLLHYCKPPLFPLWKKGGREIKSIKVIMLLIYELIQPIALQMTRLKFPLCPDNMAIITNYASSPH